MMLMDEGAGVVVFVEAAVVAVTTEIGGVAVGAGWVLVLLALRGGGLRERL